MPRYIREPYGYGQRSGKKIPLRKAVYDGIYRGLRDSPEWVDEDHPQRYPIPVVDKEALENPLPRDEAFSHTVHVNRLVDGETFEPLPLWGPLKANLSENVSVQGSYTQAGLTVTYTLQLAPPVRTGTIELSGSLRAIGSFGVGATAGAQVSVQTLSAVAQLDDGVSILVFPSFILATLSADIGFDAAAVTVGSAAGAQTFQVTGSLAPVPVQAAASVQALQATSALGSATVAGAVSAPTLSATASLASVTATTPFVPETKTSSGTFVVPGGVSSLTFEGIGGGGGGGQGGGSTAGEGGGGGEYASVTISVTPGNSHNFTVGAAGSPSGAGGATIFFDTDGTTPLVQANGGGAGTNAAVGTGGAGGVGDITNNGGAGAPESTESDGQGGGGAGGPSGAGSAGSGTSGGASGGGTLADGVSTPGSGGTGGTSGSTGANGSAYGGGGGGGDIGAVGGSGGPGVLVIS